LRGASSIVLFVAVARLVEGTASAQGAARAPEGAPSVVALPATPGPDAQRSPVESGGLTAEWVGRRAAETSYSAKAARENVRSAAARVDQAWAAFLPRLTGTFKYTRLSDFTPPSLGSGSLVGTPAPPGTPNPTPTQATGFSFPVVLDNWSLEAQVVIPISDYFLRINQAYSAATKSREAARLDVVSADARASTEGKLAFYDWLRARASVSVAEQSLLAAKTHLADAKNLFDAGIASRADVLRAETGVAGAELAVEHTKNLVEITRKQVALAIHSADGERQALGEGIEIDPPIFSGNLADLVAEGKASRTEVRGIDINVEAAKKQAAAVRAGAYPSFAAFGAATYANPNARRIPQSPEWFGTWAVGAQLTWTPSDTFGALAGAHDIEARVAAAELQKSAIRDGVELEITQAYQSIKEAEVASATSTRQVRSAEEAYRVARDLFLVGRATSTTLTDAESDLTRARLAQVNARIDLRTSRVRLDHATGRDAKSFDR
jgi:outer membrane protein